jgi:uncharacterized protein YjbI with pentapeptide repeats
MAHLTDATLDEVMRRAAFGRDNLASIPLFQWDNGFARLFADGLDLSDLDLQYIDLTGSFLRNCDLSRTNFSRSNLKDADFEECTIQQTRFENCFMVNSHLIDCIGVGTSFDASNLADTTFIACTILGGSFKETSLQGASFYDCRLHGVHFKQTDMKAARFNNIEFHDSDFSGSGLDETIFVSSDGLGEAKGLEHVRHFGPAVLDLYTIRRSIDDLPDVFLLGMGMQANEIATFRALYTQGIQFYSCFLSHADPDYELADRLRTDLIANDVSCWHYRHDMQGGKFWRTQVQTAIKLHDKLVLICSENSVLRQNVVDEIIAAMERERETGEQKLFPIRLDDFILSRDMLEIADAAMESGRWREDWVRYVRSYHIPDFSGWKDHDSYQREFQKLTRDLKNPNPR